MNHNTIRLRFKWDAPIERIKLAHSRYMAGIRLSTTADILPYAQLSKLGIWKIYPKYPLLPNETIKYPDNYEFYAKLWYTSSIGEVQLAIKTLLETNYIEYANISTF